MSKQSLPESADILLVEDQPSDAELAARALQQEGLDMRLAVMRCGSELLDYIFSRGEHASRQPVDLPLLILLDLKLPRVSGDEVLEQLKADERTKHIPVVMLTSSREAQDVERCYQLGVNSFVVKPVDSTRFAETVQRLARYWITINEPPRTRSL